MASSSSSSSSTTGDHYETATSNPRTQTYPRQQQQQLQPSQPQNQYQPLQAAVVPTRALAINPTSNNQVSETDDDEADEDQDSEALLYKMLQQQNFLPSSSWQDNKANSLQTGSGTQPNGNGRQGSSGRVTSGGSGGVTTQPLTDSSNSRRMIKLLESYSHIHQVDDSDDQIRGTGTRLAPRRSSASSPSRSTNYSPRTNDHHHHHHHHNTR